MPVQLKQPIQCITEQEFHDLDFQIMRWAFDAHNQLGRFYDEKIYQNELLNTCRDNGLIAETELKNLHWINLCRSAVNFTSLQNSNLSKLFCP